MTDNLIPEIILEQIRTELLGKKIVVYDKHKRRHVGICDFIGYNKYIPKFGLQVNINNTPITNLELKNISIYENNF